MLFNSDLVRSTACLRCQGSVEVYSNKEIDVCFAPPKMALTMKGKLNCRAYKGILSATSR